MFIKCDLIKFVANVRVFSQSININVKYGTGC